MNDTLLLARDRSTIEASRFRMGEETSATFRCFLETIKGVNLPLRALKGQIAGPFTLLTGLKDQDGRALIYDERFLDIIPKLLGLKARWQIELMRTFGVPVMIFLDEPGLAGFGSSAFITVSAELVLRLLSRSGRRRPCSRRDRRGSRLRQH